MYKAIDESGMLAYLTYMAERLIEMKRILKSTGSIYLHCDSTASHYLKIIMDGIFGIANFRNEIVWKRTSSAAKGSQSSSKTWGANTDSILFYTKTNSYKLVPLREITKQELTEKFPKIDENGKRCNTATPCISLSIFGR